MFLNYLFKGFLGPGTCFSCSGRFSDHNYGPKVQKSWFWTRNKGFLMFLGFLGFRFSELFSKKSIPHGPSGQTTMWKRIPYGSSPCQVFVTNCRKYLFLPIKFHFFMKTLFPPFVRLRPVQAGFCVSTQTPGNILAIYWDTYNLTHWVRSQRTTHDG